MKLNKIAEHYLSTKLQDWNKKIEIGIKSSLEGIEKIEEARTTAFLKRAQNKTNALKLSRIKLLVLKTVKVALKIFRTNTEAIDTLLHSNRTAMLISRKITEILHPELMVIPHKLSSPKCSLEKKLSYLMQVQVVQLQTILNRFKRVPYNDRDILKEFQNLPSFVREKIQEIQYRRYKTSPYTNPKDIFKKDKKGITVIEEFMNQFLKQQNGVPKLDSQDKVIYDVSTETVLSHSYRRESSDGESCICIHNFTNEETTFTTTSKQLPEEVFNSDKLEFGGKGRENSSITVQVKNGLYTYSVNVPPLTSIVIKESAVT